MTLSRKLIFTPILSLLLAACGSGATGEKHEEESSQGHAEEEKHGDEGRIGLTADQIAAAAIQVGRPTIGGTSMIELPATIESDPQGTQLVSAAIGGRIAALSRNLGESIRKGEMLAVIESREAAAMNAEIEAAQARLTLAHSNLAREQRLFAQRVSPEQDLIAARTTAAEAGIALRLARQQRAAAGAGGGGLNRLGIVAPLSGQIIARSVVLGQTVAADAELYRIANLSRLSLTFSLQPADAGRVRPGGTVTVTAAGRQGSARISFVSPALDPHTQLVPVIAAIDNQAGQWRAGEPVTAAVQLSSGSDDRSIRVPSTAVQTVEGKPALFVRTRDGFEVRPVTLGGHAGAMVLIRSGLNGSEQIATTNSFTLKAELGKGEASHEDH